MPEPVLKNMVITQVDERMINLFTESCAVVDYTRTEAFLSMLRNWMNDILRELEMNPECDTLAIDSLHAQIEQLMPTPRELRGGYVN